MPLTRRHIVHMLSSMSGGSAIASGPPLGVVQAAGPKAETAPVGEHDMSHFPAHWYGREKIAFLAYPQFTALDLVGPHYMLGNLMGATSYIVAKTTEAVVSDMKLAIMPTATFDTCPADLDIIVVPGGTAGTLAAMQDKATIDFLRDRATRARYVTSVCTGSLVLGAAGLLKGYRATSHWVTRDLLSTFGATPVNARVVFDRDRITGAGVTAGLDFGLALAAERRDADYAKALQLLAEYQPEPPFDAGTPQRAGKEVTGMMTAMFKDFLIDARRAAEKAMAHL